jgi:hypothetical protein
MLQAETHQYTTPFLGFGLALRMVLAPAQVLDSSKL